MVHGYKFAEWNIQVEGEGQEARHSSKCHLYARDCQRTFNVHRYPIILVKRDICSKKVFSSVLCSTVIIIEPSFIKDNTMKFEVKIFNTYD